LIILFFQGLKKLSPIFYAFYLLFPFLEGVAALADGVVVFIGGALRASSPTFSSSKKSPRERLRRISQLINNFQTRPIKNQAPKPEKTPKKSSIQTCPVTKFKPQIMQGVRLKVQAPPPESREQL